MIRLQSISIECFRGIREGRIKGLTDVNLLVGRNNSGKTTVVESIQRVASQAGFKHDILGRDLSFWQSMRQASSQDLMWYRQDKSKDVVITGSITESTSPGSRQDITFRIPGNMPPGGVVIPRFSIDEQRMRTFFSVISVLRPFDAFSPQIEQKFWPALLSNRRDKGLTTALNEVFGLNAESFQLLPNNQLMVLFDNYGLPLDSQGDGTRTAVRTMIVLTMMRDTLLMLEEPECHQHPGSLERFSAALCKLAKSQNVQLIISTHSIDCVRSFMLAARTAKSEAAVFHLTLNDGKQDARRLDPEAVETLTSTGIDVRCLDLYA
jgi:predicted ATPase